MSSDTGKAYLTYSRHRLLEEYLPRIERCLDELTPDDLWWRAHETDNSVGNLILHLNGNVRQWIIGGLGGSTNERDRDLEFNQREHIPASELRPMLRATMEEAAQVIEQFDPARLLEIRHIQKYDVTCLDALSHVVEHFAQHLGQIIYVTKLRRAKDLRFWNL